MYGESVDVNPEDVEEVESNPDYTVYQANPRSNPGEVLTKVVYNNPGDGTTLPEDFMQSTSATQTMQETGMDDGSGIETMEEDLPLGMPLEERDSVLPHFTVEEVIHHPQALALLVGET